MLAHGSPTTVPLPMRLMQAKEGRENNLVPRNWCHRSQEDLTQQGTEEQVPSDRQEVIQQQRCLDPFRKQSHLASTKCQ